jgi:hypothetical protein
MRKGWCAPAARRRRALLDATLARCRAHGEHLFVPELLRVRGVAMLEHARTVGADLSVACEADGQRHLQMAIETANAQGAGMWALRSSLDLADHLIERGRTAQASTLVAGIVQDFDPRSRARRAPAAAGAEFRASGRGARAVPPARPTRRRRRGAAGA